MKKILTICFFIATTFTVNAQTLNGSCYDNGQGTSSYFSQVDLNATFSFYAKNNLVYIRCSNLRMNVPSNTTYNAYGKSYTKSDLGISQWPQNQKPWSMTINVSGSYNGGNFNKSISCSGNYICDEFHIEGIRADNVNISSFKVNSISNFTYNQGGDAQLEELIKQKNKQESQKTNSSSTASTNSESSNPLGTSNTSTTETTSQTPSLEEQYTKLGIPANTPTYSKQEATNQLVTQAGSLAGELLNDWNTNRENRIEAERAAYNQKRSIEIDEELKKYEEKFIAEYLPLMDKAKSGDENARMTLYFASESLFSKEYVPQRDQWFEEALKNNNTDAILEVARLEGKTDFKKSIPYLQRAISLGSVDAMVILANYYGYYAESAVEKENTFKLLYKASELGSPNAMYYLGKMYKYGGIHNSGIKKHDKILPKFDIILDDKIALELYIKSIKPDYKESIYSKSLLYNGDHFMDRLSSYFETASYFEISNIIYKKKGKIVIAGYEEIAKKFKYVSQRYSSENNQKFKD